MKLRNQKFVFFVVLVFYAITSCSGIHIDPIDEFSDNAGSDVDSVSTDNVSHGDDFSDTSGNDVDVDVDVVSTNDIIHNDDSSDTSGSDVDVDVDVVSTNDVIHSDDSSDTSGSDVDVGLDVVSTNDIVHNDDFSDTSGSEYDSGNANRGDDSATGNVTREESGGVDSSNDGFGDSDDQNDFNGDSPMISEDLDESNSILTNSDVVSDSSLSDKDTAGDVEVNAPVEGFEDYESVNDGNELSGSGLSDAGPSDSKPSDREFVDVELSDGFDFYFNKFTTDIDLYGLNSAYSKDELTEVVKASSFRMLVPDDVSLDTQSNGDWNLVWDDFYCGDDSKSLSDLRNGSNKFRVRIITIDRDIPVGASNDYITNLFLGYLSASSFNKMGVYKWKPYIDENLSSILLSKGIVSRFVNSGLKISPADRNWFINYFVFTFYSAERSKLVFLLFAFEFHLSTLGLLESDGLLDDYYKNWISFVSSFNFL